MLTTMTDSHSMHLDDLRWHAVETRDKTADGSFVYAVKTTGVYCRPACPSRLALRKNVAFFNSPAGARQAGYRPCKKCSPDAAVEPNPKAELVRKACAYIEASEEMPKLADLAAYVGLSRHHFLRVFKKAVGVTPRAYAAELRANRVRGELAAGEPVTSALYGAGYGAASRFYAEAGERLGMDPSQYRKGGAGAEIRFAVAETSLGALLVAATDKGVCSIELADDAAALIARLEDRFPKANLVAGDAAFEALVSRVCGYVERPEGTLDLPLDIRGTAFQQQVWSALRAIPAGNTATYSDIAAAIGRPTAVRAVASACASNTLAVAVPCHRVVRTDGSLSGYRWGVERKKDLLMREGAV